MADETKPNVPSSSTQSDDVKLEDIENGNADKNEEDTPKSDKEEDKEKSNGDEKTDSEKAPTPRGASPITEHPPSPREEKAPTPSNEKPDTHTEEKSETPVKEDKLETPVPDAENNENKDTEETNEKDDTQSVHSDRPKSETKSVRSERPKSETKSDHSDRPKSVASAKEPVENLISRKNTNDDLTTKSDKDLSTKEFFRKLREDTLFLSREIAEWRETYSVDVDSDETKRILEGEPSLVNFGLTDTEREIAGEVVKGKMSELKDMSLDQLVNFVSMDNI